MKTKAVILAGGRGTRLHPLTQDLPKTLIPIHGKPIIEYILERIVDIGTIEIIIVIGHYGEKIKKLVGRDYKGVLVKYITNPIYAQTNSTYSLYLTKDVVGEDFLVINADTVFNREILKSLVESNYEIALSIDDTVSGVLPEDNMKVTIIDGLLRRASKNIPPERTHGDAIGIYRFKGKGTKFLFSELSQLVDRNITDQLFTFAVNSMMKKKNIYPVSTNGLSWIEIDDNNDLQEARIVVKNILDEENNIVSSRKIFRGIE